MSSAASMTTAYWAPWLGFSVGAVGGAGKMTTATITWVDPTTRADGSVLAASAIAGIDIFDSASGTTAIGSVAAGVGTFKTAPLAVGSHVFTLDCRDTAGGRSVLTAGIPETVIAPPSPPSGVAVVLGP